MVASPGVNDVSVACCALQDKWTMPRPSRPDRGGRTVRTQTAQRQTRGPLPTTGRGGCPSSGAGAALLLSFHRCRVCGALCGNVRLICALSFSLCVVMSPSIHRSYSKLCTSVDRRLGRALRRRTVATTTTTQKTAAPAPDRIERAAWSGGSRRGEAERRGPPTQTARRADEHLKKAENSDGSKYKIAMRKSAQARGRAYLTSAVTF